MSQSHLSTTHIAKSQKSFSHLSLSGSWHVPPVKSASSITKPGILKSPQKTASAKISKTTAKPPKTVTMTVLKVPDILRASCSNLRGFPEQLLPDPPKFYKSTCTSEPTVERKLSLLLPTSKKTLHITNSHTWAHTAPNKCHSGVLNKLPGRSLSDTRLAIESRSSLTASRSSSQALKKRTVKSASADRTSSREMLISGEMIDPSTTPRSNVELPKIKSVINAWSKREEKENTDGPEASEEECQAVGLWRGLATVVKPKMPNQATRVAHVKTVQKKVNSRVRKTLLTFEKRMRRNLHDPLDWELRVFGLRYPAGFGYFLANDFTYSSKVEPELCKLYDVIMGLEDKEMQDQLLCFLDDFKIKRKVLQTMDHTRRQLLREVVRWLNRQPAKEAAEHTPPPFLPAEKNLRVCYESVYTALERLCLLKTNIDYVTNRSFRVSQSSPRTRSPSVDSKLLELLDQYPAYNEICTIIDEARKPYNEYRMNDLQDLMSHFIQKMYEGEEKTKTFKELVDRKRNALRFTLGAQATIEVRMAELLIRHKELLELEEQARKEEEARKKVEARKARSDELKQKGDLYDVGVQTQPKETPKIKTKLLTPHAYDALSIGSSPIAAFIRDSSNLMRTARADVNTTKRPSSAPIKITYSMDNTAMSATKSVTKTVGKPKGHAKTDDVITPLKKSSTTEKTDDVIKPLKKSSTTETIDDAITPLKKSSTTETIDDVITPLKKSSTTEKTDDVITPLKKSSTTEKTDDVITPLKKSSTTEKTDDVKKPLKKSSTTEKTYDVKKPLKKSSTTEKTDDVIKPLKKFSSIEKKDDAMKPPKKFSSIEKPDDVMKPLKKVSSIEKKHQRSLSISQPPSCNVSRQSSVNVSRQSSVNVSRQSSRTSRRSSSASSDERLAEEEPADLLVMVKGFTGRVLSQIVGLKDTLLHQREQARLELEKISIKESQVNRLVKALQFILDKLQRQASSLPKLFSVKNTLEVRNRVPALHCCRFCSCNLSTDHVTVNATIKTVGKSVNKCQHYQTMLNTVKDVYSNIDHELRGAQTMLNQTLQTLAWSQASAEAADKMALNETVDQSIEELVRELLQNNPRDDFEQAVKHDDLEQALKRAAVVAQTTGILTDHVIALQQSSKIRLTEIMHEDENLNPLTDQLQKAEELLEDGCVWMARERWSGVVLQAARVLKTCMCPYCACYNSPFNDGLQSVVGLQGRHEVRLGIALSSCLASVEQGLDAVLAVWQDGDRPLLVSGVSPEILRYAENAKLELLNISEKLWTYSCGTPDAV